jgi:hypothetical protein
MCNKPKIKSKILFPKFLGLMRQKKMVWLVRMMTVSPKKTLVKNLVWKYCMGPMGLGLRCKVGSRVMLVVI